MKALPQKADKECRPASYGMQKSTVVSQMQVSCFLKEPENEREKRGGEAQSSC